MQEFVERITTSNDLVLAEKCRKHWETSKVFITRCHYGGYRTDRIRDRNSITNTFGFEECRSPKFMSCDDLDGNSGTFLANILSDYGTNYYFIESGEILSFETDVTITGSGYMNFRGVKHINPKVIT